LSCAPGASAIAPVSLRTRWDNLGTVIGKECSTEVGVEIKIGVVDSPRELTVVSRQSPDEVESLVADAMNNTETVLALTDEKGRRLLVPSQRLAYVEIGVSETPRVGFGVS
jgi:hypothetical protein